MFDAPNGVDTDLHRPPSPGEKEALRAKLGFGSEVIVIYTGRLVPVKGIDTLVRAMSGVQGARLLILGHGAEQGNLERLAEECQVSDRVTFLGFTLDVGQYLRASDIFVLSSASEGLSNSLLEAMASGLPSVVTPVLDNDEISHRGEHPVLVAKQGDPVMWAEALDRLVGDEALRAAMGKAAAGLIRDRLTIDHTADKLITAYSTVMDGVRRSGGEPTPGGPTP